MSASKDINLSSAELKKQRKKELKKQDFDLARQSAAQILNDIQSQNLQNFDEYQPNQDLKDSIINYYNLHWLKSVINVLFITLILNAAMSFDIKFYNNYYLYYTLLFAVFFTLIKHHFVYLYFITQNTKATTKERFIILHKVFNHSFKFKIYFLLLFVLFTFYYICYNYHFVFYFMQDLLHFTALQNTIFKINASLDLTLDYALFPFFYLNSFFIFILISIKIYEKWSL